MPASVKTILVLFLLVVGSRVAIAGTGWQVILCNQTPDNIILSSGGQSTFWHADDYSNNNVVPPLSSRPNNCIGRYYEDEGNIDTGFDIVAVADYPKPGANTFVYFWNQQNANPYRPNQLIPDDQITCTNSHFFESQNCIGWFAPGIRVPTFFLDDAAGTYGTIHATIVFGASGAR